jgi:hypothetical protein
MHRELKPKTLQSVLRQANITIEDLLDNLWGSLSAKLCPFVWFVDDEWQDPDLRDGVLMHNLVVSAAHRAAFGETVRACWWHVTELTLEHLRGSLHPLIGLSMGREPLDRPK